jgi:hypothetical protein
MKKLLISLCVAVTLITAPVAFVGCKQLPGFSQQSSDQIILRAEQTAETAKLTFKTFLHLERENEALLLKVNPAIHGWAEKLRSHGNATAPGIDWIVSLRNATKTFEANRTAENQATLNTILITLTQAVADTNNYIAQSKKAIAP